MGQNEELRQEVEIGQPARRELEVPGIALALLLRDQRPHRSDRFGDGGRVAPAGQDRPDRGLRAGRQIGVSGDDASPRQRHLLPELGLAGMIGLEA